MTTNVHSLKSGVDSNVEFQNKNLDALKQAQKKYFDYIQEVGKMQIDHFHSRIEDAHSSIQNLVSSKSLQEKAKSHIQLLKEFFEKNVQHTHKITQHFVKSHRDIAAPVKEQLKENIKKTKEATKKS